MYHLLYENFVEDNAQTAVIIPGCRDANTTVDVVSVGEHVFAGL